LGEYRSSFIVANFGFKYQQIPFQKKVSRARAIWNFLAVPAS